MSDTTLINQLRSLGDEGFPVCWRAADSIEQQAAELTRCKTGIGNLMADVVDAEAQLAQQAAQIAEKDAEIARLTECLSKANANHEHFERAWYLRGDEVEALRADAERLRQLLSDARSALDYHQEQTRPIHSTRTALAAIDAALRQEQPT